MADIQRDIDQIATARYGREVRGSIVNALTLMNEESSEAIDKAVTAQDSASASAEEARTYADRLVDLSGGTANQVLTKNSNADFDYSWQNSQGGGGASDAYEVTYGDTNVGDTLDVMPRLSGEVQTVAPAPKDADTLGGRYSAEDIDAINTDLTELSKNEVGSRTDITSYSANFFTCPTDGYIFLYNTSTQNGYVFIGTYAQLSVGGVGGRFSVYVRKGTKIKFSGGSTTIAVFCPLE